VTDGKPYPTVAYAQTPHVTRLRNWTFRKTKLTLKCSVSHQNKSFQKAAGKRNAIDFAKKHILIYKL